MDTPLGKYGGDQKPPSEADPSSDDSEVIDVCGIAPTKGHTEGSDVAKEKSTIAYGNEDAAKTAETKKSTAASAGPPLRPNVMQDYAAAQQFPLPYQRNIIPSSGMFPIMPGFGIGGGGFAGLLPNIPPHFVMPPTAPWQSGFKHPSPPDVAPPMTPRKGAAKANPVAKQQKRRLVNKPQHEQVLWDEREPPATKQRMAFDVEETAGTPLPDISTFFRQPTTGGSLSLGVGLGAGAVLGAPHHTGSMVPHTPAPVQETPLPRPTPIYPRNTLRAATPISYNPAGDIPFNNYAAAAIGAMFQARSAVTPGALPSSLYALQQMYGYLGAADQASQAMQRAGMMNAGLPPTPQNPQTIGRPTSSASQQVGTQTPRANENQKPDIM